MLLHRQPVIQRQVGVDLVAEAGFLVHAVVGGVQVVLGRVKVLVQVAHVGRVQQLFDQCGGLVPVLVLHGRVGVGGILRIGVSGHPLAPLVPGHLALRAALLGRQLVAVLADHGLQLHQRRAHAHLHVLLGIVLLDLGLAGGELHLHRVLAVAGDVAHGLPLEAGGLVHPEVGVAHVVVGRRAVAIQVGFKGGVQVLVDLVRGVGPAGIRLRQRRRGQAHQNHRQHGHQAQPGDPGFAHDA